MELLTVIGVPAVMAYGMTLVLKDIRRDQPTLRNTFEFNWNETYSTTQSSASAIKIMTSKEHEDSTKRYFAGLTNPAQQRRKFHSAGGRALWGSYDRR
jgi:hypothetical protein